MISLTLVQIQRAAGDRLYSFVPLMLLCDANAGPILRLKDAYRTRTAHNLATAYKEFTAPYATLQMRSGLHPFAAIVHLVLCLAALRAYAGFDEAVWRARLGATRRACVELAEDVWELWRGARVRRRGYSVAVVRMKGAEHRQAGPSTPGSCSQARTAVGSASPGKSARAPSTPRRVSNDSEGTLVGGYWSPSVEPAPGHFRGTDIIRRWTAQVQGPPTDTGKWGLVARRRAEAELAEYRAERGVRFELGTEWIDTWMDVAWRQFGMDEREHIGEGLYGDGELLE